MFVGAVHEAAPALTALLESPAEVVAVFTLTPRQALSTSGALDLGPMATVRAVPVFRVDDLNASIEVERMRRLSPDLIVVAGWTRLLGPDLLSLPPRGCVGFHASLLPRHRGRAPVNWAIIRGESETGNTMLYLAPGADEGDIIDQRVIPIGEEDTCATIYGRVGAAGAEMLRKHLPALLAGTAPRRPQPHGGGEVLPKRTPEMGLTDWNRPARAIHDWIRALTRPYPGAFGHFSGRRILLWRSRPPAPAEPPARPGEILGVEGEAIRVGAGGGSLLICTVQESDGGREESGAAWFTRRGLSPGARFDAVDPVEALRALGGVAGRSKSLGEGLEGGTP